MINAKFLFRLFYTLNLSQPDLSENPFLVMESVGKKRLTSSNHFVRFENGRRIKLHKISLKFN